MRLKYKAARNIIRKKIWRDNQIKAIEADLNNLEDTIRANWNTIGSINIGVLDTANTYIDKHLNRDKRALALKEWIQEINILADERASFSSCLR